MLWSIEGSKVTRNGNLVKQLASEAEAREYIKKLEASLDRVVAATYSRDVREKDAKSGVALPDGSFPIPDKNALSDAIHAYGRAKDKAAAKAHIIKRAKALGATDMLPQNW